jgi:hypothetical protein
MLGLPSHTGATSGYPEGVWHLGLGTLDGAVANGLSRKTLVPITALRFTDNSISTPAHPDETGFGNSGERP